MLPCKSVKDKAMCVHPRSRCFSPCLRQIGGECNYVCVPKKSADGFSHAWGSGRARTFARSSCRTVQLSSWIQIHSYQLITATLKNHKDASLKETTESVLSVCLPLGVLTSESVRSVLCVQWDVSHSQTCSVH